MSMRPLTSARRLDPVARAFVGLCVAVCTAAGAQEAPTLNGMSAQDADGTRTYSCVDLNDALARRRLQDQPCKLPMVHVPATRDPTVHPTPRWPTYPARSPESDGHPMFWRFPVQPAGPHGVARHTR